MAIWPASQISRLFIMQQVKVLSGSLNVPHMFLKISNIRVYAIKVSKHNYEKSKEL